MKLYKQDTQYLKNQLCAELGGRTLAKIVLDSVSPDGVRLVTMEIVMPRIVLAEFNTHRTMSRSSASSRAIPVEKMIQRVEEDPYIPEHWDKNCAGMQGKEVLEGQQAEIAKEEWLRARTLAVIEAHRLLERQVHKQITNRLLEPFMWHTVICTATEYSNFFHLRNNKDAHPAIARTARCMQAIYEENQPQLVPWGDWHCPYVPLDEHIDERDGHGLSLEAAIKVSTARCARVSYLTHDGVRDVAKDIELHDKLLTSGHCSPLEHVAQANNHSFHEYPRSNFRAPWLQYRKTIANEHDILGAKHG